jgi:hypothetical protein
MRTSNSNQTLGSHRTVLFPIISLRRVSLCRARPRKVCRCNPSVGIGEAKLTRDSRSCLASARHRPIQHPRWATVLPHSTRARRSSAGEWLSRKFMMRTSEAFSRPSNTDKACPVSWDFPFGADWHAWTPPMPTLLRHVLHARRPCFDGARSLLFDLEWHRTWADAESLRPAGGDLAV